jgi:transposase-like protein
MGVRLPKTGAGAQPRPALLALGLRSEGKKEIIDFLLANGQSGACWAAEDLRISI